MHIIVFFCVLKYQKKKIPDFFSEFPNYQKILKITRKNTPKIRFFLDAVKIFAFDEIYESHKCIFLAPQARNFTFQNDFPLPEIAQIIKFRPCGASPKWDLPRWLSGNTRKKYQNFFRSPELPEKITRKNKNYQKKKNYDVQGTKTWRPFSDADAAIKKGIVVNGKAHSGELGDGWNQPNCTISYLNSDWGNCAV